MTRRFTIDGGAALEERIARDCARVRDAVRAEAGAGELHALILGGGYGRGEGGVCLRDGVEDIYNDYDFFVVTPKTSRRARFGLWRRLNELGRRMYAEMGVHVDFGVPLALRALPWLPYELMMMELKEGHLVLHGPEDALAAMPAWDASRPPLAEGARLLMNRGTGLLLARRVLRRNAQPEGEDFEFVVRNIQKAMLAAGDAVLFVRGAYSPSYARRGATFAELGPGNRPECEELAEAYAGAIAFKLRPAHRLPKGMTLASWHAAAVGLFEKVHLWFERQRLTGPAMDWEAYAALPRRLVSASAGERFLNMARNLRGGAAGMAGPMRWGLHPRDLLLGLLPRVLYRGDAALEEGYLRVWERYN